MVTFLGDTNGWPHVAAFPCILGAVAVLFVGK
jgi:hypothetical protein